MIVTFLMTEQNVLLHINLPQHKEKTSAPTYKDIRNGMSLSSICFTAILKKERKSNRMVHSPLRSED